MSTGSTITAIAAIVVGVSASTPALAGPGSTSAAPWEACFGQAAQRYRVPARLLRAIARAESGMDPNAIGRNPNSRDLGLMQINERWLPVLGLEASDLLDNPCLNIQVGAWILAQAIEREGYTWQAVGAYNAGHHPARQARREAYARRVARFLASEEEQTR